MSSIARRSRGQASRSRAAASGSHSKPSCSLLSAPPSSSDERGEDRDQGYLVDPVPVERLDPAQIVEPLRRETGFFTQLTKRGLARGLARLDAPMHHFPGPGAAALPARDEAPGLQARARASERIQIHEGHPERGHGVQPPNLASKLDPACCDFSGWNCTPSTFSRPTMVGKNPP